jgi:hypothetical protein
MTDKKKITLEDIEFLSKEIDANNKTIQDINLVIDQLTLKRGDYICQYIIDNSLFKDSVWDLKSHGDSLSYVGDKDDPIITTLKNIIGDTYADLLTGNGVELYYSELSLTANFDNHSLMPDFVKKFQIKIDGAEVLSRIKRMNKEMDPLMDLCHFFNLK